MSNVVIRVENLSKRYRIGQYVGGQYQHRTLRDVLTDGMHAPFRRLQARSKHLGVGSTPIATSHQPSGDFVWALKDVSFEVKQGEVMGIIGRNGAGKTTLLKLLSRITEPTGGRAMIKGRIGSLLGVGTGFHAELTGRENIYLSGAILGMTKKEVDRKFDEIVAFAGLEKFIDTPVKRYSSGMVVRLGFAVAAHLEPEILLVDEVLAVGDAAFQKKCMGKMRNVAGEGRTVLFVSHNMGAIQNLTRRCLLLKNGKLVSDDNSVDIVEAYLEELLAAPNSTSGSLETDIPGFRVESIELDEEQLEYGFNKPLKFDLHVKSDKSISDLTVALQTFNSIGARIMTPKIVVPRLNPGDSVVSMILENHYLPPGRYSLHVEMDMLGRGVFNRRDALSFEISEIGIEDPFLATRGDRLGVYPPVKYYVRELEHSEK